MTPTDLEENCKGALEYLVNDLGRDASEFITLDDLERMHTEFVEEGKWPEAVDGEVGAFVVSDVKEWAARMYEREHGERPHSIEIYDSGDDIFIHLLDVEGETISLAAIEFQSRQLKFRLVKPTRVFSILPELKSDDKADVFEDWDLLILEWSDPEKQDALPPYDDDLYADDVSTLRDGDELDSLGSDN